MAITTEEGREEILAELGEAIDRLALAAQRFGDAYELMSAHAGEKLESDLYMPAQKAFGRSKRTYTRFAEMYALQPQSFQAPAPGAPSHGAKGLIEQGVAAAAEGEHLIAELQDSGKPVEFGDADLRAGLADVRAGLGPLTRSAQEFVRTLGR
jgi:hypothetical protein